jgi:lipoprotein NlpD
MDYGISYITRFLLSLTIILFLFGCDKNNSYAPVVEGWQQSRVALSYYKVQKGDTIYSIAWAFDMDYRELACINHLSEPYRIRVGQQLYMSLSRQKKSKTEAIKISHILNKAPQSRNIRCWQWPARGKIIKKFALHEGGNKGIDISGHFGEPVVASANGIVVYSGSGLRGYGKLVIIKHNANFLSAYAYNKHILVTEGQTIKTGQKIATMGRDNSGRIDLHFEIRLNGKPVNPLHYLGGKFGTNQYRRNNNQC